VPATLGCWEDVEAWTVIFVKRARHLAVASGGTREQLAHIDGRFDPKERIVAT
jgi:hypothetical protein